MNDNLNLEKEAQLLIQLHKKELINKNISYKDLTHLDSYSIDSKDTIEVDDALSIEYLDRDMSKIWIHISDLVSVLPLESEIDILARNKACTIYSQTNNYMLPIELIKYCSFNTAKKSLAISVGVILDSEGQVVSYEVSRTMVKLKYRLSYEEADELIELCPPEDKHLEFIYKLMNLRNRYRHRNGAISLDQTKGKITEENNQLSLLLIEQTRSRLLVSEAMILMGTIIGDYANKNKIAIIYRVQAQSYLPENHILQKWQEGCIRNSIVKFKLNKAKYSFNPGIHFSLAIENYVQFTSPIRRYLDLVAHRQISNLLDNKNIIDKLQYNSIIQHTFEKINESISIMNENNRVQFVSWLLQNSKDRIEKIIFLRWFNKKENYALVYFSEYYIEISLTVQGIDNAQTGDIISVITNIDSKLSLTLSPVLSQ